MFILLPSSEEKQAQSIENKQPELTTRKGKNVVEAAVLSKSDVVD